MEKFLREYVKMIAEVKEVKLNKKQLDQIVNNLEAEDEIWETLDYYVDEEINGLEVE